MYKKYLGNSPFETPRSRYYFDKVHMRLPSIPAAIDASIPDSAIRYM